HVGKRSVTVVVEKAVGVAFVVERAGECVGAEVLALGIRIELQIIPNKEIEFAVAVVIKPGCARSKMGILDSRPRRDVSKCSVPIVLVENGRIPVGDVNVLVAVIVIVAD